MWLILWTVYHLEPVTSCQYIQRKNQTEERRTDEWVTRKGSLHQTLG